ncbi:hypothetical protein HF521_015965 [Silurus meridionalis]|uniref:HEPN domain-containing protein n=1 Tax=Silurus meridionalis TaxID=175797 RepID=A0A8T0BQJ9_SILME|nr:hypothetical protein HF521_015965 [Silurus meridionalis]
MASPDSDYEFKNNLHSTYKFMQENIEQFRKEMNNKSISWLWAQNEFVSPREVVLTYPAELDLSLYIKKVPEEFLQYNELLREFGVKETLADEEIEAILSDIKENIDDRIPPYGKPSELKMSIAILDWMRKNEKNLKDTTPVPVMAQNQNFTLQPLKTTVFCDISDDGLNDLKQDEEEFYVIHEEVLPVTAKWLKIPFLSTRILKPQIIVDEEEYEGIEQCGQTEPITLRIKNILKEYDDENDIFKELLQNAEDAGAITCGFMLDFRVHPTEGLIDEGMALCNGPCLWAFNNELFSEEDWKNIVRANRLENSLKTKLKLLVKLHQCHLTDDPYEHQKLLQLLPKQSQLKLLSGVISVNLVDGQVEHCDYGSSCEFSGWFQKRLSSREFLHGLMCLIREQSKGTISQTEAVHMCESTFGKIQIVCCQALHTELLLNHQPLEGTAMETQVYVKKQEDECVFYLKHNDNMALKVVNEVNMYLTKEINALLENILNSLCLSVLGQLLLCENMEDVERALEQHGVRNTVSDEKGLGFRPNPGTPIQEEWHDSLDMDPLNRFEKGEYVGFCKDELENEYVFAIVVECLDKHSGDTRQNPSRYRIQIGDEKFIEVSSLDLYQFKREKQSAPDGNATCTDFFQLLSQSESSQSEPSQSKPSQSEPSQSKSSQFEPSPKKSVTQTLEEAKIEIDQSLEQIWKMSDEDKSKAIRRLYLRWHPDKNPDNMELFTEAFKYLMNRIDELQQGKSKCNTSTQSNTTHSYNFRDFYEKWNYEAKSHKRGRERFYQNNFRQQYNFWSHFQETPRPNKEEAKRWYRQAECDLNAAQNDTGCNVYPEWCLFKVHQAVEKALIATEFRRNGQHPGTASTITCLAQKISKYATYLNDLPNIVSNLKSIGVDAKITQYPNFYPPPHIPNDRFKAADAQEAVNIATKLLRKLEIYITE